MFFFDETYSSSGRRGSAMSRTLIFFVFFHISHSGLLIDVNFVSSLVYHIIFLKPSRTSDYFRALIHDLIQNETAGSVWKREGLSDSKLFCDFASAKIWANILCLLLIQHNQPARKRDYILVTDFFSGSSCAKPKWLFPPKALLPSVPSQIQKRCVHLRYQKNTLSFLQMI